MWAEKMNAWALELGRRGMDREEESMGAKGSPYPLIKAAGILRRFNLCLPTHWLEVNGCPVNSRQISEDNFITYKI